MSHRSIRTNRPKKVYKKNFLKLYSRQENTLTEEPILEEVCGETNHEPPKGAARMSARL